MVEKGEMFQVYCYRKAVAILRTIAVNNEHSRKEKQSRTSTTTFCTNNVLPEPDSCYSKLKFEEFCLSPQFYTSLDFTSLMCANFLINSQ